MNGNTIRTLAAYSTIKGMVDSEKYRNPYLILAEFIKALISSKSLYSFSVLEIIDHLKEENQFEIPYAVAKAALKRIDGLKREGDTFLVIKMPEADAVFQDINEKAGIASTKIIEKLTTYVLEKDKAICLDKLEQEFIKYVLDIRSNQDYQYFDLISKFCLQIEDDVELQQEIDKIREGSVLYCGLCYNLIETGSITEKLTLYLDTEVLFQIAGFDGPLCKKVADDLLELVKKANQKEKKIHLVYFKEVKEEIDRFFAYACRVVKKRGLVTTRAMATIVNGCIHESDVLDKQSDFYTVLNNKYGIRLADEKDSYYNPEDHKYNMESLDVLEKNDPNVEEAYRFISHINVLRKGEEQTDYTKVKHLIITETKKIQETSDKIRVPHKCGYALPLSKITNILWVKLGAVFGKGTFPCNAEIAVKARLVLDRSIASSVTRYFNQAVSQYKAGELDEDKAAGRLLRLQERIIEPEKINSTNVDELLDFSAESLQKYDDALKLNEKEIDQRNAIIIGLQDESKAKDDTIRDLEKQAKDKDQMIAEQKNVIDGYLAKEHKKEPKQEKKEKRSKGWLAIWLVPIVLLGIFLLSIFVFHWFSISNDAWVAVGIGYMAYYGGAALTKMSNDKKIKVSKELEKK